MVALIPPLDILRSVPFRLGLGDTTTGSRLGGLAPVGVAPRRSGASIEYFATVVIPFDPGREVSLFLDPEELFTNAGVIFNGRELGPVQVVVHQNSRRGSAPEGRSSLADRLFVPDAERGDWYESADGERVRLGRHKVGGRPAIFKYWELEEAVAARQDDGYIQVLQLDIPGPDDDLDVGDWPFGDGMFHLLGRQPFGDDDWIVFWES